MKQLHMHIISQDFQSQCLKNKKHWNSFTTSFFLDAEQLIHSLRAEKRYKVGRFVFKVECSVNVNLSSLSLSLFESFPQVNKADAEELLNGPLRCHVCSIQLPTIPKLKLHIATHQ